MSAYVETETELRDRECLLKALQDLGFHPKVGQNLCLEGYEGSRRPETADIVIPRAQLGTASNDVGFRKGADGRYTAVVSDFDRRTAFSTARLGLLKQRYARHLVEKIARSRGYRIESETRTTDGRVQIRLRSRG